MGRNGVPEETSRTRNNRFFFGVTIVLITVAYYSIKTKNLGSVR